MRFLADENVDSQIVSALRGAGHEVAYVAELEPGISDDQVLELAKRTGSLLLTEDKDFGELVFRMRRQTYGVILIRLAGLSSQEKVEIVGAIIIAHPDELQNSFSVINPKGVRIRHHFLG
jgi:predicted nuclease of predicted toxin-antitoxin system